nr:cleavage stimulating factor 64 [Ipomoea batatas]
METGEKISHVEEHHRPLDALQPPACSAPRRMQQSSLAAPAMSQQSSIGGNRSSPSSLQPSSTPPRSREPRRKVSPAQHPASPPITRRTINALLHVSRGTVARTQKRTMAGKEVAGEGLSANIAGMSKNQLYDIMCQMKKLMEQNEKQARQILIQNPTLARDLFQQSGTQMHAFTNHVSCSMKPPGTQWDPSFMQGQPQTSKSATTPVTIIRGEVHHIRTVSQSSWKLHATNRGSAWIPGLPESAPTGLLPARHHHSSQPNGPLEISLLDNQHKVMSLTPEQINSLLQSKGLQVPSVATDAA